MQVTVSQPPLSWQKPIDLCHNIFMMLWIAQWILNALALYIVAHIVSGISLGSFGSAMIAIVVMSIINMLVKPLLFVLTLPITIVTFGLFTLILNAVMLILVSKFTPGFHVEGLWPALIGSLLYSIIATILHTLVR